MLLSLSSYTGNPDIDTIKERCDSAIEGRQLTHLVRRAGVAFFISADTLRDFPIARLSNLAKTSLNKAVSHRFPADIECIGLVAVLGL